MTFPVYPVILTKADWDKKKGVFAKLFTGETGVGAAMTAAKAAYDKMDRATLSPKQQYKTFAELDEAFEAAKKAYGPVEACRKLLHTLSSKANDAAGKFKASKVVPASATAHALAISKAAGDLAVELKSLDEAFKAVRKNVQAKYDIAKKNILAGVALCESNGPKVLKDPTPDNYSSVLWQGLRTLAAAVAVSPDFAAFKVETKTLSSLAPEKLNDANKMKEHVNKVLNLAGRIKAAAA